uniref:Peptidase M14 domain-containing protein n=1 Tax=Megaselia scalaris TaxID=36166 RepID=T1GEZ0_MEGSC
MLLQVLSLSIIVCGSLAFDGCKILEISPKSTQQSNVIEKLTNSYDFIKRTRKEPSQVLVRPEEEKEITAILRQSKIDFKIIYQFNFNSKNSDGTQEYCDADKSYCFYKEANNFYSAGMHAREWISPAVGLYVIKELIEKPSENKQLLETHDWVIMPLINADGYEFTRSDPKNRLWRKTRKPYGNCFGVDPNRNFDYKFGFSGTSTNECSDIFRGPKPFSEPETAVLRDVLKFYTGRISFYLTLHSHGGYLLYPWGYDQIDAQNKNELEDVAQAGYQAIFKLSGRKYEVGNSAKLLYAAAGASDDFAYHEGARISITMELPSGGPTGFDPPPKDIKKYVEESWVGIRAMASKVIEKYNKK